MLSFIQCIPANTKKIWLITIHRKKNKNTQFVHLIQLHTSLPVKEVEDKEEMQAGTIYLSPPNYHLLIEPDFQAELDAGEPVHFCRPAIDVLLESLSRSAPTNSCGILLSGANKDGGNGMAALHQKGGLCLVQDPNSSNYSIMPQSAIDRKAADIVFTPSEIAELMQRLHQ